MDEVRYAVKVRPALWGFISSVGKDTRWTVSGDGWTGWTSWEPEPTYWRPTEAWAIRRAKRKRSRLLAQDCRHNSIRTVE